MTGLGKIAATVAVAAVMSAGLVYTGAYNVAADAPHSRLGLKLLQTVTQRSVHVRSSQIDVPDLSADPSQLAIGAEHYAEMCAECHLAPNKADSELRRGLYPEPPNLMEAGHLDAAEAFWVIKHGIKLTSMPAWGATHDDATIWSIVAFIQKLPTLTAEDYRNLVGSGDDSEAPEHHHEAQGDHTDHHTGDVPTHAESAGHTHEHGGHHHEHPEASPPAARPGA